MNCQPINVAGPSVPFGACRVSKPGYWWPSYYARASNGQWIQLSRQERDHLTKTSTQERQVKSTHPFHYGPKKPLPEFIRRLASVMVYYSEPTQNAIDDLETKAKGPRTIETI